MLKEILFVTLQLTLLYCCKCIVHHHAHSRVSDTELFLRVARNSTVITDKVTDHSYHEMYGVHLMPLIKTMHSDNQNVKLLEIGLGCGMGYGAGVSALLWMRLLRETDEIWEGDFKGECIKNMRNDGTLDKRINTVVGDQSSTEDMHRWVKETGGNFSVIVDDGGHANQLIYTSFMVLFQEALAPGGLYFIEDLSFSRYPERLWLKHAPDGKIMVDIIKDWIEQLLTPPPNPVKWPIPKGIKWIMCQYEACVIAKCKTNDVARCSK